MILGALCVGADIVRLRARIARPYTHYAKTARRVVAPYQPFVATDLVRPQLQDV